MPLSTLKVPSNIGLFLLFAFIREMRFFVFWLEKCSKTLKNATFRYFFDIRQLLFYDLPPKNASKYPKITIFRFANTVIFKIRQLWEPKNAPKSIFFAQIKAWGSPQICNRNLHISFTMGCREDFFNKTQKTGGRGEFCPCLVELGLRKWIFVIVKKNFI